MLIFVTTFSVLYRLLNKLHKLEFEKNSNQLRAFFLVFLLMASNVSFIDKIGSMNSHFLNYTKELKMLTEYCQTKSTFNVIYNWVHVTTDTTQILSLLLIYVILLKSPDDVLSGVSKLDSIVKISIFQQYKMKERQQEQTIATNTVTTSLAGDHENRSQD